MECCAVDAVKRDAGRRRVADVAVFDPDVREIAKRFGAELIALQRVLSVHPVTEISRQARALVAFRQMASSPLSMSQSAMCTLSQESMSMPSLLGSRDAELRTVVVLTCTLLHWKK